MLYFEWTQTFHTYFAINRQCTISYILIEIRKQKKRSITQLKQKKVVHKNYTKRLAVITHKGEPDQCNLSHVHKKHESRGIQPDFEIKDRSRQKFKMLRYGSE